jgi:nicotinate phosphoribosyltransferase
LRRDHGADAGLKAARSAFIGGAGGSSNVLAGHMFGIPVSGTMAHSYVMAFDDEAEAFRRYAGDHPGRAVLLIDTFDTEQGARRAAQVARELRSEGIDVLGVRLDSGDLERLSRTVRTILDDAGLHAVKILASGDLDECRIQRLVLSQAPIDGFGVGTQLGTSADAPSLGGVYKLVQYGDRPVLKLSSHKKTLPGKKQVYRVDDSGTPDHDVIALEGEEVGGRPLLELVMNDGRRVTPQEPLVRMRERCAAGLDSLPDPLRDLEVEPAAYAVTRSPGLDAMIADMAEQRAGGSRH